MDHGFKLLKIGGKSTVQPYSRFNTCLFHSSQGDFRVGFAEGVWFFRKNMFASFRRGNNLTNMLRVWRSQHNRVD